LGWQCGRAHWETESKNYGSQINLEKDGNVKAVEKGRKNIIMKIKEREIKQVNRLPTLTVR
jgi:hypothetical protein